MGDMLRYATLALAVSLSTLVHAQYPNRPVRLIVAQPPGGQTDTVARVMAGPLGDRLKQSVIVENRPGASGLVGALGVVNADPDGYTLLLNTGIPLTSLFQAGQSIDLLRDLVPVTDVFTTSPLLVVHSSIPVRTAGELMAYVKANPGKLAFGSTASQHLLAWHKLGKMLGVELTTVPFNGNAPNQQALFAGTVQVALLTIAPSIGAEKEGRVRMVAYAGPARNQLIPDVPTIREAGVPELESEFRLFVWAPAKTPSEAVSTLNRATAAVVKTPEFSATLRKLEYASGDGMSVAEARRSVEAQLKYWTDLVREAGYKP